MTKYYSYSRGISKTHPVHTLITKLPTGIAHLFTLIGETLAFYKVHKPFKKLRVKYSLQKRRTYPDELEGDINLLCDLTELFPQKNLPENYVTIAPLYFETEKFYSQVNKMIDKTKKTIFVSMGSTGEWKNVAFLNDVHYKKYNIIAAGSNIDPLSASHIIKVPFINIHEIFDHTDLVICQGGNGTIYQSLLYGIPLLCKTSHFEQEWNVEALERLQAGKSLDTITSTAAYIQVVDEWIIKKETGFNQLYTSKVKEAVENLGKAIRMVAMSISTSNAAAGSRKCIGNRV